jgi:serine/threonine protein kinase
VSDDFKLMLSKMLEKNPSKRYTASQCLQLPLLLKEEQISISKALDDFNIKLKQEINTTLISSTQICIRNN